ncbi:MAG: transketolase family protein [Clostridia bacterium]|nr:transketolase family protein [Clostridia bacterium]
MADLKATRDAYGEGLVALAEQYPNFYVLDADLAKATKTITFKKQYPDRFIDCGIAEGNMIGVAAGLATCGNTVFASSFSMFAAGRAFEQIRNSVAYPHLNVKVIGTHSGLTVGEDGATHQCLEDLALMRSIPGMVVINPSDATQMKAALRFAVEYDGPVYIRGGRLAVPVVYEEGSISYTAGQSYRIAEGDDVTLMFCGHFHELTAQVREMLAKVGLTCRIVDMPSVKPVDNKAIEDALKDTGLIVTFEDHNINGGFGSAVCEAVCDCNVTTKGQSVIRIGVEDSFGKSGTPAQLMEKYGFTAENVCRKILTVVAPEKLSQL